MMILFVLPNESRRIHASLTLIYLIMSNKVYKEMTNEELQKKLTDTRSEYEKMCLQHSVSQIENPSQIKFTRRSIARMITELKNRDINI